MLRQRTIKTAVHAIGVGVHSAKKVRMTLRPAGENTGILFTRTDSLKACALKATAHNVCDTTLSTTISHKDLRVSTVEHLMSALWGLGIDNLIVELSSEEVPIMDGSAAPFIYLINTVGVVEQAAAKKYIRIKNEVTVRNGDSFATLKPFAGFKAGYTFVADHPVYNRYPKRAELDFSKASYVDHVSRARSFGLMNELEQAQRMNKCLGSSLENAVGVNDFNVVNPEGLRYNDEFAKHKLLDAIGDLYLLGSPIIGAFNGYKSGHAMNNQLARKLLETQDAFEMVTLNGRDREVVRPILQPASAG
ncbi:MAG: UDP-3-O-acyl-N-acetylglucosamine deacetylase [Proteobacteria bacterium]|nr:UDP-3-O-acyl-N-acetylglucosamine deacetylase [Pseudomonadota bacterium]